ncbi:MAG: hypothetical protein IKS96_11835 [Fibrobacter sp.]|nr:hypothetical protein [Fibrobacter sp.]
MTNITIHLLWIKNPSTGITARKEYIFAISTPKNEKLMKKFCSLLFILSLCLFALAGCDDTTSSKEDYYRMELGAITKETLETAMSKLQNISIISYDAVSEVRNYLYENTLSDHQTYTGVPSSDIEELMSSRGYPSENIAIEMNFLQKNGNDILFFEHGIAPDKRVWIYITK